MITSGIHNVSAISKVGITVNQSNKLKGMGNAEGWISFTVETHSEWTDERASLEITLFCRDIATAVSQLEDGIASAKVDNEVEEATAIG